MCGLIALSVALGLHNSNLIDKGGGMTKEEGIKQGAIGRVKAELESPCDWAEETLAERIVDRLWYYLHSQGLVIRVDRVLPECEVEYNGKWVFCENSGSQWNH